MDRRRAQKALHPDPYRRYDELSEFMFDLRHPNKNFLKSSAVPFIERDPLLFWKLLSGVLFIFALIVSILLLSEFGKH